MLPSQQQQYKILLVDVQSNETDTLVKALKGTNLEVVHLFNGQAACDYCTTNQPNLIITELDLPQVSGIQLFRQLKSNFITSHIPIIVTTKESNLEDKLKSMEMGIDDYIEKPYAPDEVVARTLSLLNEVKVIEKNRGAINQGFKGNLAEMNVVDLIKAMQLSKMSGIIYLTRGYKQGQIFVGKGTIVDAFIEGFESEQALTHMLTWLEGTFWVSLQNIDRTKAINSNNQKILSTGTKLIEKWKELAKGLPPLSTSLKAIPPDSGKAITTPEKQMLNQYSEPKTILQGIEESKMTDLDALELVKSLLQKGLLIKGHPSKKIGDPFAQIVLDHIESGSSEENYNKITSYFKREDYLPTTGETGPATVPVKNDSITKLSFKIYLTKRDLLLIKEKLHKL